MPYLSAALKESGRLTPIVMANPSRITTRAVRLGPYVLPPNTVVGPAHYAIHHDPNIWPNPDTFIPERFMEGTEHCRTNVPFSWLQFSAGGRQCPGMNFSLLEQRLVIAMLLKRFTFRLVKGSPHLDKLKPGNKWLSCPENLELIFERRY